MIKEKRELNIKQIVGNKRKMYANIIKEQNPQKKYKIQNIIRILI